MAGTYSNYRNLDTGREPMPIYEYKCPMCAHTLERIEHHSKVFPPVCIECKVTMERIQFSRSGEPKFVGPGFYATDYKEKP